MVWYFNYFKESHALALNKYLTFNASKKALHTNNFNVPKNKRLLLKILQYSKIEKSHALKSRRS